MYFNKSLFFTLFLCLFVYSCQQKDIYEDISFNNNILEKININAESKEIINLNEIKFSEPFIDHVMEIHPAERIESWINENIFTFGSINRLVINIYDISVTQNDLPVENKNKFIENKENIYEIKILVGYILLDENDYVLSTTKVEVKRSTTSKDFISLSERNRTLDLLVFEALKDLSKKSVELINKHMVDYVI